MPLLAKPTCEDGLILSGPCAGVCTPAIRLGRHNVPGHSRAAGYPGMLAAGPGVAGCSRQEQDSQNETRFRLQRAGAVRPLRLPVGGRVKKRKARVWVRFVVPFDFLALTLPFTSAALSRRTYHLAGDRSGRYSGSQGLTG